MTHEQREVYLSENKIMTNKRYVIADNSKPFGILTFEIYRLDFRFAR